MMKHVIHVSFSFLLLIQIYGQLNNDTNNCECVPFYLCANSTINTNGEGLLDIRIQQDCPRYIEVCCEKRNISRELTIPVSSANEVGCGYRNTNGVGYRLLGNEDNEAQFGEFPWMIAIFHKAKHFNKHMYKCGGSLIHPQVVLTAAHCIIHGNSFIVRAGEWDGTTTNEMYPHEDRKVISWVIHQNYKKSNLANDVALLFLDSPFDLVSHINVVCLPPPHSIILSNECVVTGWGKDKYEQVEINQNILKKVELPMISHEQCQKNFQKTRLGRNFRLDRSFNCAGGDEGRDACIGDGGGPLICPIPGEKDRYQQVGIVSWGIGCGSKGVPGAYADIPYLRSWIDDQIRKKHFNSTPYQL